MPRRRQCGVLEAAGFEKGYLRGAMQRTVQALNTTRSVVSQDGNVTLECWSCPTTQSD
jgi:hypothetical protein